MPYRCGVLVRMLGLVSSDLEMLYMKWSPLQEG